MSSHGTASVVDLNVQRRRRSTEAISARLIDATDDWLRESSFDASTVSEVAARAGVCLTTADRLFPSVDDLVVETCLRRIRGVGLSADASRRSLAEAAEHLSQMMLVAAEEPAVATACVAVFLNDGQTADRAREQIGLEIHRLIASAMGPGSWPEVVTTLEFLFSGALIQAAMGTVSLQGAANAIETAVSLILEGMPRS